MDLIQVIKDKINTLENGDYSKGLNAILTHIEVAFRHLERGQKVIFNALQMLYIEQIKPLKVALRSYIEF